MKIFSLGHTSKPGYGYETNQRSDMAKYISLLNYSTDALAGFGDLGQRLSEARAAASGMGVTMESYYLTMGQYDAVVIADAPDNDTVAKFILAMAGTGRFSIQTLAAFDEATAVGPQDSAAASRAPSPCG